MKSNLQIGFGIAVLMGIVLVAAYVTQYTKPYEVPKPIIDGPPKPGPTVQPELIFDTQVALWRKDIETYDDEADRLKFLRSVELNVKNHYVFWAHNPNSQPVTIAMKHANCKCTDVDYALFAPEDWETWLQREAVSATIEGLGGPSLLGPAALVPLLESVTFKPLPGPGAESLPQVPPRGVNGLPAMIRVNFQPKNLSTDPKNGELLLVTIQAQVPHTPPGEKHLTAHYEVVPGLGHLPHSLDAGEIDLGGKQSVKILIWSVTREAFKPEFVVVGPEPGDKNDPCIEIGEPVFKSATELAALQKDLEGKFKSSLKPLSACEVPITVHERRGERQLDMGPIMRTIILDANTADTIRIPFAGVVRGEVRVLGGDDRDRIRLGSFNYKQGVVRSVTLATTRPELDLAIHETTGTPLEAKLSAPRMADGQKQWELTVTILPDTTAGEFTAGTAVVLMTKDKIPRKLRIPVTGTAAR